MLKFKITTFYIICPWSNVTDYYFVGEAAQNISHIGDSSIA